MAKRRNLVRVVLAKSVLEALARSAVAVHEENAALVEIAALARTEALVVVRAVLLKAARSTLATWDSAQLKAFWRTLSRNTEESPMSIFQKTLVVVAAVLVSLPLRTESMLRMPVI
jgi:hypothetical protein